MGRGLRRAGLCALLCLYTLPALALDPLLMMLFSIAKEVAAHAARKGPAEPAVTLAVPSERYPGTAVEPEQLRQLIDACFTYLSRAQRREIFDALHASLSDPKNAAVRGTMIEYFVTHAVAVRDAQQRLSRLSQRESDRLVADFKNSLATMPPEDAAQVGELLRQRVLPVPDALNAQLLAAIDSRR